MQLPNGDTIYTLSNRIFSLPNVCLAPKVFAYTDPLGSYVLRFSTPELATVVWEVASKNPLWTMHIDSCLNANAENNGKRIFVAALVTVKDGTEELGQIGTEYSRRSNAHTVYVYNERIKRSRERNGGKQFTSDPKKAVSVIKKMFFRKTTNEILAGASKQADGVMTHVVWEHERKDGSLLHNIRPAAVNYAVRVVNDRFREFLNETGDTSTLNSLDAYAAHEEKLLACKSVHKMYQSNQTALVVMDNGGYWVKWMGEPQAYTDSTLPATLRRPLGMLKLVEKSQLVSDSGLRVDDRVFIVIPDADEQPQENSDV